MQEFKNQITSWGDDHSDGFTTCKYTEDHWIVQFKWVNFMVCKLYLNKTVKIKYIL